MKRSHLRLTALRHEADTLGVPHADLLASLRYVGALSRMPGAGHIVRRGWSDKFRDVRVHGAIQSEDGRLCHREISMVYCTRKGRRWLPGFLAEFQARRDDSARDFTETSRTA